MSLFQKQYDTFKRRVDSGEILTPQELATLKKIEAELSTENDDELVFTSVKEVEEYTSYKSSAIYSAVREGKLVKQPSGSFLQADVDTWLVFKGHKSKAKGRLADDPEKEPYEWDKEKEEARYRHFRAGREEVLYGQLIGSLIPREDVEQLFVKRAHEFKTSLLLLSRMISHKIGAKVGMETVDVAKIVNEEVRFMLAKVTASDEIDTQ